MSRDIEIYSMICPKCECTEFKFTEASPTSPVCQCCGHVLSDEHIQEVLKAIWRDYKAQEASK